MSLIRPAARAALARWGEAGIGAAVAALGVWWIAAGIGLLFWVGIPVALAGAAATFAGVQRGRFGGAAEGPGVVRVDEGRIEYFGPLTGGVVDVADLDTLSLDPGARPAHWLLTAPGQDPLQVPVTASGADALFDAFARLPGIRTEFMLAQLRGGAAGPVVIWRSAAARDRVRRLH